MRGGIMQAYATVGFKKHLLTSVITIVDWLIFNFGLKTCRQPVTSAPALLPSAHASALLDSPGLSYHLFITSPIFVIFPADA
jgi:hypothetical protein